jgi:ribosome maturation factor RimP
MTARNAISTEARSIITERLLAAGIELLDIEYERDSQGLILRIYIDTPQGVDTDTCATATRTIKDFIDGLNNLDYDYLEVSSPGIDRALNQDSDFVKYRGSKVMVKTIKPVESKKKFIGILAGVNLNILDLEMDGKLIHLDRAMISVVRLHPDI